MKTSSLAIAITCLVLGVLLLMTLGCTPAPSCQTRQVRWTDFDDAGRVIGHRVVPLTICR